MPKVSKYQGPDRRSAPTEAGAERGPVAVGLAAVSVLAVGSWLAIATNLRDAVLPFRPHLHVAGLVVAIVGSFGAQALWRATGRIFGCRVGTASRALVGMIVIDLVAPTAGYPVAALRSALSAVAAGWLLWTATGPDVDSRVSTVRDTAYATAACLAIFGVLTPVVGAEAFGDRQMDVVDLVSVTWWSAVAAVTIVRSLATRSSLLRWLAWATGGLAVAEMTRYLASSGAFPAEVPWAGMRLIALLLVTLGILKVFVTTTSGRRGELFHAVQQERRREQVRRSEAAEREHEVRNALLAIEGATLTLHRHRPHLSEQIETELESTIVHELAQLRGLLGSSGAGSPTTPTTATFRLTDPIRAQVELARTRGLAIELSLPESVAEEVHGDVAAAGRVVGNLLRNAEVHGRGAFGEPIDVEVERNDGWFRVCVRDRGRGVRPGHEEHIFGRGVRSDAEGPGQGLGLYLARRTMEAFGGDLHHEHPPGGGARFVARFPVDPDDVRCERAAGTSPATHTTSTATRLPARPDPAPGSAR